MKRYIYFILLLLSGVFVRAQEPVWLSNQPPASMKKMIKASGMHRYSSLISKKKRSRTGSTKPKKGKKASHKRPLTRYVHWIRKGGSVEKAPYICLSGSDYQWKMMSPAKKEVLVEYVEDSVCYASFPLNEEGYYNLYLITRHGSGDTLYVNIAKAELLSHSCRNGHHKKLEARPLEFYPQITDFEIVRQRRPHETYHFFVSSGDVMNFTPLYRGKPVPGVQMNLYTQK